ncbi:MAG: tetrahydromethanopterin S-methyltransferase subunit D [Methanopyri archaeon]|jgi:tetrahydromethanopterin S-methyltransferase subunit D|nr:tetrahydromethanopterin S-methyltransferase subunit D [Methanopyri archaeon]
MGLNARGFGISIPLLIAATIVAILGTWWLSIDKIIANLILVTFGSVLITIGVHYVPVGGAPAAMATATGVGTGTTQLAAGSGLTGLITAAAMSDKPFVVILWNGAIGAALMIAITMLVGNFIYIYGVGVPPCSAKVDKDPITGWDQDPYVTPGTEGHGIPTVSFVSGIFGGLLGGAGGGMVYFSLYKVLKMSPALAGITAMGIFYANSVLASYNIGGTIEGYHDPKFKRVHRAIISSIVFGIVAAIFTYAISYWVM